MTFFRPLYPSASGGRTRTRMADDPAKSSCNSTVYIVIIVILVLILLFGGGYVWAGEPTVSQMETDVSDLFEDPWTPVEHAAMSMAPGAAAPCAMGDIGVNFGTGKSSLADCQSTCVKDAGCKGVMFHQMDNGGTPAHICAHVKKAGCMSAKACTPSKGKVCIWEYTARDASAPVPKPKATAKGTAHAAAGTSKTGDDSWW